MALREAAAEPLRDDGAGAGRLGLVRRQIDKHRSLREKVTGANRLAVDDPLSALIERVVRQDGDASEVEVDRSE